VSFGIRGAPFPPEAARWHSPRSSHPPVGAHRHGQAPSAVQGHPGVHHLKLFRYFNDSECSSPPCWGGRGSVPFPAGAADRREPGDMDRCGGCCAPGGAPQPRLAGRCTEFLLSAVGSVSFNPQPSFPLPSIFPTAVRDGWRRWPCHPLPCTRAGPARHFEQALPVRHSGSVCLDWLFSLVLKKPCQFGAGL